MAVMPGALWKPVTKNRGRRTKGRGVCLHVAVSEAASLQGFFQGASSDSHFYVRKDGTVEQYVDTEFVAYANAGGNGTLISVETQGGVTNTEGERWTAAQVASLARICRWAHDLEGIPLQLMPNSLPSSRGIGWHKQGVNPWVVPGGEVWSSAYGKVCPGLAKIAQVPAVIAAAKSGTVEEEDVPLTEVEINAIADRIANRSIGTSASGASMEAWEAWRESAANSRKLADVLAALKTAPAQPATPAPVAVDAAAVAAALAGNKDFLTAMAKAVADEQYRRQEN